MRKCRILSMPSLCGMFVYREDTSIDTNRQSVGYGLLSIRLIKSVEFCMKDGSFFM